MSYRIPAGHPVQKPNRYPQIDWKHPLSVKLAAAWSVPDRFQSAPDGVDAWHYRIPNGVDDNYARVEGTVTSSVGPHGAVIGFPSVAGPGTAAYVVNAPGILYQDPMSLFVRARIPALGSWNWLVARSGGSWLGINPANKLSWTVFPGLDHLSSATVGDGAWHTVGMTLLGGNLQLYIDGLPDNNFTGVTLSVTSADMFWGHNGNWTEFFRGEMESVYLWKRALTAPEVSQLQSDPFGFYQTNRLARYYTMSSRNLAATGDRVTQVAVEVAYPALAAPANPARVTQEVLEVAYLPGSASDAVSAYSGGTSGSLTALLYRPGMPTGPTWSASYSDPFGGPFPETFTYTRVANLLNATIVTDADGIAPSGNVTYDQTPTLSFSSTGAIGTGPFLYTWQVTIGGTDSASGTLVASGAIVATTQITLPTLAPASGYHLYLTARSREGTPTAITPLVFTILARRPPPAAVAFLELPPFDLTPVSTPDPEYLRYLPRWMSVHGTAAAPPASALLFRLLSPMLGEQARLTETGQALADQTGLAAAPANLPRLAWRLQSRLKGTDAPLLSVRASGDVRPLRRAVSDYDFFTADDPCYLLDDTGQMLFRNLALREVTTAAVGTSGALFTQYQMPAEGQGMVPDENVLFRRGGAWYRIRGGSPAIDPYHAAVQLSAGLSGTLTFRYQSESYVPLVQVAVSGQPWATPAALDLWNRFDEIGLYGALSRRPGEDNLSFRSRLTARLAAPPGNTPETARLAMAADLALVNVLGWDGLARLDLAASGFTGVRSALVPDLPAIDTWEGRLYPDGDRQYYAGKSDWLPGWQVTVDGHPATKLSYPGIQAAGAKVDFGQSVSGMVAGSLRFRNWNLEFTNGFVTALTPCSGNVASGHYQVLLSQNVQLFAPSDPGYQQTALLNADGTPNQFFLELKERLLADSPVHFTRARWGAAYWFAPGEEEPQLSHLPVPLDRFVDSSGITR